MRYSVSMLYKKMDNIGETTMSKHLIMALILILFLIFSPTRSVLPQNDDAEIAFLDIVMTDSSIAIVDTAIRPGVLREYHWFKKEGILYVVFSAQGDTLWKGMLDNPLIRRYEYLDDQEQFRRMHEHVNRADFTIRIPHSDDVDHIRFYNVRFPLDNIQKTQSQRKLIRRISLRDLLKNRGL